MFTLHSQLEADALLVGRLKLCQLRLMNNRLFPWVILAPERESIREIHELSDDDQALLWKEITFVSSALAQYFKADKMNFAALGNVVPQLHIHIIARYQHDPAWPKPVWNSGLSETYDEEKKEERIKEVRAACNLGSSAV